MKIFFSKCMSVAFLFILISSASTALASPPWAYIRSMTHAGTGCPAGTVAENLALDRKAFTLIFDAFVAEGGPGVPFRDRRKNCHILIDLQFPQGWTYSIFTVDYRGYASLDREVRGIQQSSYYFQGQQLGPRFRTRLTGPYDGDYQRRDTLGISALAWSRCGMRRALNINAQVIVNNRYNRRGEGVMTLDSIDGQIRHIYGIMWKRCPRR